MRKWLLLLLTASMVLKADAQRSTENIIILTLDGLRWQEIFRGMDSAIANNRDFNQDDSQYIHKHYWNEDPGERRKRIFPFLWTTIAKRGLVAGNRDLGNLVNNANPYWFSYPGYSEIMTGYADTAINRNDYPPNPHVTVLEFLNKQPSLKGKVAAFGAWDAFDRILNEQRSGIPVICAFDSTGGKSPTANERLINKMLSDSYRPWLGAECLDVFTHYAAMEYLKTKRPRVLYIAYGETDEWAHSGMYRSYLDAARQVDEWIGEIWNWVQTDPRYRNKTTLFITTDHGRGDVVKKEWTSHNNKITGANEIWYAVIGPDTPAKGELKNKTQVYQKQFAQTIARFLGYTYKAKHPIAAAVEGL